MIFLLTLFSSLIIQFGSVSLPYKVNEFDFIDSVKDYLNNYTGAPDEFYWFANNDIPYIVQRFSLNSDGSGAYNVYFPIENYNTSVSSSITPGYDGFRGQFTLYNFCGCQFLINSDGSHVTLNGGFNTTSSVAFNYFFPNDSALGSYSYGRIVGLYNYYIYNGSDLILFNDPSFSLSGHTQNGKNEHTNTLLPFPNAPSITGHSSVSSVDDSNTNNLLGNILNSIQYGANSVINGINNLGYFIGNLWGNINSTINYVIAPVDSEEFVDIVGHSSFATTYTNLQELKNSFVNMAPKDGVPIEFTLPDSMGGGTYSFNLATYLNGTKRTWQPLLLIFLYAGAVWGLYKSFANLVNGIAPGADYVRGAAWNFYEPPVEIRKKDKHL